MKNKELYKEIGLIDDSKPYKNDLFKILYNLYGDYLDAEYKNDSSEKLNSTIFIFQNLESAIRKYSEKHNLNADEIIDAFTHDEVLALLKDVKKQIKRDTNDMLASFDWSDVNESLTEGVEYNRDEVDDLAAEYIGDLRRMGDNPWDETNKDFIDWAWGGNVPEEEIPYITGRFNYMRELWETWRPKNRVGESVVNAKEKRLYKGLMKDILVGLYKDYKEDVLEGETSEEDGPKQYIYDRLLVTIDKTLSSGAGVDRDRFIDSFTDEEVDNMIDRIIK